MFLLCVGGGKVPLNPIQLVLVLKDNIKPGVKLGVVGFDCAVMIIAKY